MLDLFATITPQTPILTPNRRLAAVYIKKYNIWQMQAGKTSWLSLDILPLTSWVKRMWLEFTASQFDAAPFLLSPEAEQIIWETIIRLSPDKDLLQVTGTAELARAAWGILRQWQVDSAHPELQTTEDGVVFQRWAQEFIKLCETNQWLDLNSLTAAVSTQIQCGSVTPPQKIILAGFTEITPAHKALLNACEAVHTQITIYEAERSANTVRRVCLLDEDTEIHSMARWAKHLHEKDQQAMIGCVVPNLANLRPRIIEIFSEVFAANNAYVLDPTTLPFNISAGKSLTQYHIIHLALQLLRLNKHSITIDILSSLLFSPFLVAADTEQFARAQLLAQLQKDNVASISLGGLLNGDYLKDCPALYTSLQKIKEHTSSQKKQPLSAWVTSFMTTLQLFGWPGERNLNSPEYQTAETWLKLLNEFTHFELFLGPVNYTDALHFLTYLTTSQIYQPESPETTVQILGALEAAEIPFDHLWVMGLDDSTWPQAPQPNPFIPLRMQRNLNMPHATAERELAFTQQLTVQLRDSAKDVIFSYASLLEDLPLRPSPIISEIAEIAPVQLQLADFVPASLQIFAARSLEKIQDENAPALAGTENPRGGTAIFKNQAACPFKAFAENRLVARKHDPITLGLRADQRGNILHKAMELIWLELGSQQNLLGMPDDELHDLIASSIEIAITQKAKSKMTGNKYYLRLEALRLQQLLLRWLTLEKLRPPFKIKSLEVRTSATFGNIPINFSADRIDESADGKHIIIDYKTGKNLSINNWFGDRPDEPQLPLYCVLNRETTTGILFALINPVKMEWQGISERTLNIRGVKAIADDKEISWSEQIDEWNATLSELASDFYHGKARVDPKLDEQTCQYCHLQALCRINETVTL
jgi:ATP-dependent helicase/nuclease subunit B